ncbi:MAG TPA: hypothetical protein V6D12_07115 [Candidatus Obscuribacterales bacterium]
MAAVTTNVVLDVEGFAVAFAVANLVETEAPALLIERFSSIAQRLQTADIHFGGNSESFFT